MPASPDRCGGGHLTELQMWGKSWGKGKEKEQDQITSVSEMWDRVLKFLDKWRYYPRLANHARKHIINYLSLLT